MRVIGGLCINSEGLDDYMNGCLERKFAHDFLCAGNKDAGVPVYIEIHKRNKNAGTQTLLIFYKIQIRFPIQMRSADSLPAVI